MRQQSLLVVYRLYKVRLAVEVNIIAESCMLVLVINEILLKQQSKKRLSISALETLSIIAYKQPVIKSDIEKIRGVNCDYTIQKLLDKELIKIEGKSDKVGRPLIYITSEKFIDYFGINNLDQLRTIKDFQKEENSIGDEEDF